MKIRTTLIMIGLTAVALSWAPAQARAQTQVIGPVPSTTPGAPNYSIPNYANSPLPTLSGSLTGVRLTDPGCGYSGVPTVVIDPPLDANGVPIGVQATATAAVGVNGALTITMGVLGSGYITVPNVAIYNTNNLGAAVICNCGATAVAQMGVVAGTGLRKFMDSLPGLNTPNDLQQQIPVAVANAPYGATPLYLGSDYYEIALVEYRVQMHKDLPATGTKIRGYVQIVPSTYTGAIPLTIAGAGLTYDTTYYGASKPNYLGPLILASKNVPTRIKFYNLLPTGTPGNLFLPVDTTLMGAGPFDVNWDPANPAHPAVSPNITGNFTENRATLHLHGGLTPWISDGTPHQWTTPAGDLTKYPQGMSTSYVPDMPVPSQGTMTFYYPNQQSGRLMFYHDHAYGLTRLNVYAGEAAGYLLTDPDERALNITAGVAATSEIPVVIQDKTFVWGSTAKSGTGFATDGTYAVDPLWATVVPGSLPGDLWFPHVYMPNQNPADPMSGANSLGRWDYGPWFWPAQTAGINPMPIVSTTPEAFMDTPVVNGTAYPYVNVPAGVVRLRILNACNDRMLNLQLYQADTNNYSIDVYGNSVLPGTAGSFPTEVAMVPAIATPSIPFPPLWLSQVPGMIPEILDNRPGGVPDPRLRGPAMVIIGDEGGLLPAPVVLPNTPVGYEQNKKNIVVLNVSKSTLLLGPAVRADVLIDFTAYAGKTVLLYNDCPAPIPAGDPRIDYYTGNGDYSATAGANNQGGAPATLPGYGPNTRTILQFRVAGTAPATAPVGNEVPSTLIAVSNAVVTAFVNRGETPIIPQPSYPIGTPGYSPVPTYSRIQDTTLSFVPVGGSGVSIITVTAGGTGYTTPTVTIDPPPVPGTAATIGAVTVVGGAITDIQVATPGSGYFTPPVVHIADPVLTAAGAAATASIGMMSMSMLPKAIHELFDPYGRMNSVLGVELPFTSFLIQTTIPYQYIDPATEKIPAGQTQIWKITHNGVDSHAIHFHLVNVQVINRVGWDGAIRLPEPSELGWKETVRMNPLEDCIVAATARLPMLPFQVPSSTRPLDVTLPLGTTAQFTGINPIDGTPLTVANAFTDFGWEYVWHCHLLGHEENDMMRPLIATGVTPAMYYVAPPIMSAAMTPGPNAAGWYNATAPAIAVTLTATPSLINAPLVGVASVAYSASGATTIGFTSTVNPTPAPPAPFSATVSSAISAEGITTINYFGTDAGIVPSTAKAVALVQIDKTPPTVSAVGTPLANLAGWNKANVTVTITGADTLSGVASITYSASGAQTIATTTVAGVTAAPVITANGTTTVSFTATDKAGNVSTTGTFTVKLDKTAPTVSSTQAPAAIPPGWNKTNVTVTITGADAVSTVASITYSAIGSNPIAAQTVAGATAVAIISLEGTTTLSYTATDAAGNVSATGTQIVRLDMTAPTVTVSATRAGASQNVKVSGTVTDALSGARTGNNAVTYNITASGFSPLNQSINVAANGTYSTGNLPMPQVAGRVYTIKVTGFDIAGNSTTTTFNTAAGF